MKRTGFRRFVSVLVIALTAAFLTPRATLADEPPHQTLNTLRALNPHLTSGEQAALAIKAWALSGSEYGFFRGTADLFYQWCLAHEGHLLRPGDPRIHLHGDIHLGNIGTYQSLGKPGKNIHFGVVDLDETFMGPAQLDVLRAAVALRFLAEDRELTVSASEWQKIMDRLCTAYKSGLHDQAPGEAGRKMQRLVDSLLSEARSSKYRKYLKMYCDLDKKRFRPVRMKKGKLSDIMDPVDDTEQRRMISALWDYTQSAHDASRQILAKIHTEEDMHAAVLDVARWTRLGSSGSQGLRKYLVLIDTGDTTHEGLLILQLKEEPIPAAARAGLCRSTPGDPPSIVASQANGTREEFVADSYTRLLNPNKWMIGHARIDQTGFLMKTKDPWGEEPSTKMFPSKASLDTAAALLGTTLGRAHHNATQDDPNREATRTAIASSVNHKTLCKYSDAAATWLMERFNDLRQDPSAQALTQQAKARIKHIEQKRAAGGR